MLLQATMEDVRRYGDFAYQLALNPQQSCYPTYTDGIKTKADFLHEAQYAVTSETAELLLFCMDGTVEGWISYFRIPEDKYLQLTGFSIRRGARQALAELLEAMKTRYDGYTAYFGYPAENREAIRFLEEHGFVCMERDWNHSFFFDSYTPTACSPCIEAITRENFDAFRAVYHADAETYWNAERILETLDDWTIFVARQGDTPVAASFLTGEDGRCELYGVEFADGQFCEGVFRELLTASLNACKAAGAKTMTYFCGEREKAALHTLGFQCVGAYVLYQRKL